MKRDALDALFSKYIRLRAKSTCERCGKTYPSNSRALHCAHIFSRGKLSVRYDPRNALALCYGCHRHADQHKETVLYPLYIATHGKACFEQLQLRANLPKKLDRTAVALELRALLKELDPVAR